MSRNLHTSGEYVLNLATLFNMLNICSVLSDPLIPNASVGLQASVQHSEHALYTVDIADVALPFMRMLSEKLRMAVHLAVLDQGEAVYIEKVEAAGFFKVNTWVGRRMFLHSTSVGKCLLAWLPKDDVETIVKQQGLKKRTPKTITSITKLLADLEHAKQSGYAVDDEENSLGARCLGAPIFDGMGNVTAALGASGTLTQMDEDGMPRIIDALKETARRISRQLQRSGSAGAA